MIQVYYFNFAPYKEGLKSRAKEYLFSEDLLRARECIRKTKEVEIIAQGWVRRYVFEVVLGKEPGEDVLEVSGYGKPRFKDRSCFFNMSGTSDMIAFGICADAEIGIDVERVRLFPGAAVSGFFQQDEWKYLTQHKNEFTRIWVRKEAFLKCIGTGWRVKTDCCVTKERLFYRDLQYRIMDINLAQDMVLGVCHEGKEKREICLKEISMNQLLNLKKQDRIE